MRIKFCSSNLVCIELFSANPTVTNRAIGSAQKSLSDRYSVKNVKLLFKGIAHRAVVIELRATTGVTGDALGQTRGNIVTGLHPVDQGMTKHVTSEV